MYIVYFQNLGWMNDWMTECSGRPAVCSGSGDLLPRVVLGCPAEYLPLDLPFLLFHRSAFVERRNSMLLKENKCLEVLSC